MFFIKNTLIVSLALEGIRLTAGGGGGDFFGLKFLFFD